MIIAAVSVGGDGDFVQRSDRRPCSESCFGFQSLSRLGCPPGIGQRNFRNIAGFKIDVRFGKDRSHGKLSETVIVEVEILT